MKGSSLVVLLALFAVGALAGRFDSLVVERLENGKVHAIYGPLGRLQSEDRCADGCSHVIARLARALEVTGKEEFKLVRVETDPSGKLHYRLQQYIGGVEVDGGEAIIHHNPATDAVYAISSSIVPLSREYVRSVSSYVKEEVLSFVAQELRAPTPTQEVDEVFLYFEDQVSYVLRCRVRFIAEDRSERLAVVYVDAITGEVRFINHLSNDALDRSIYTANYTTAIPGALERTEGGPVLGDPAADGAYDNAGYCYDFYYEKFGRDSYDGQGAPLISTVHYLKDYNNAFWNGEQMVYGDGDGVFLTNFSQSLQVVCHELTHAVVQYTANLRYWKDSGALNEAWADCMGNSAVIMHNGGLTDHIWEIARGVVLIGTGRVMNNPTLDGSSYDYYPDRYKGILDNGGVHSNSGIGNLAFSLLVTGGVHPQGKTSNWVNGIGILKAEQVWYYALKNYMMRTTDFEGARVATVLAASDIFPDEDVNVVEGAWAAVGVGEPPSVPYPEGE